jgi:putative glycosyltransferase (TIGR04348 family)
MREVLIVSPAAPDSLTGNANTARRWAGILGRLGHGVRVAESYDGEPCDALIALHARRSAPSIARFHEHCPTRPLLVALTGTDLYSDIERDAEARRSLELATRLIVLQGEAPAALPEHLRARTRVIYQSVEPPEHVPERSESNFDVCVIGHLRPVKDPLRTAQAARLLPSTSRVRVVHLGGALDDTMAEAARAEETRNPRYVWRGAVSHDETLRTLASSHLHAITSRMEGGANAVCEALALGVPTVSTHIPGSIGLLGQDYPGYFPFGDTEALAQLIDRAETDPTFYQSLTTKCGDRAPLVRPEQEQAAWMQLMDEFED